MKIKAAVVDKSRNLLVETVELEPPHKGEVLVRVRAAGICHSDLHTWRGELGTPPPLVLGHEGAGTVEEVGPGVTRVKPGDAVMVNWLPACESCVACLNGHYNLCERFATTNFAGMMLDGTSRLKRLDGATLKHYLGVGTMSEYIVINEACTIRIPPDVPFDVAAITGCAVATGVGAVVNTGQVAAGNSVAVIGCGGIGLSMIQGCHLAGCHPIIAIDISSDKLEFARRMGATHIINALEVDSIAAVRQLTYHGPDYVFDSVGSARTISQALESARPGGTAVIVGLQSARGQVPLSPAELIFNNKRLLGSFVGAISPRLDLPRLVELYRAGRLELDSLISHRYSLAQLPEAFAAMEAGEITARGVVIFEA